MQDIISGTIREDNIEKAILKQIQPMNFLGSNSAEIKYERDYEELCIRLSSHTTRDVKQITVKEFYALLSYVKKQNKPDQVNRNRSYSGH